MGEQSARPAVIWIDQPAEVEIRHGIVRCTVESGGVRVEVTTTPAVLLESIRRSTAVYNRFARENGAVASTIHKEMRQKH
jgi:hypothetical protein